MSPREDNRKENHPLSVELEVTEIQDGVRPSKVQSQGFNKVGDTQYSCPDGTGEFRYYGINAHSRKNC